MLRTEFSAAGLTLSLDAKSKSIQFTKRSNSGSLSHLELTLFEFLAFFHIAWSGFFQELEQGKTILGKQDKEIGLDLVLEAKLRNLIQLRIKHGKNPKIDGNEYFRPNRSVRLKSIQVKLELDLETQHALETGQQVRIPWSTPVVLRSPDPLKPLRLDLEDLEVLTVMVSHDFLIELTTECDIDDGQQMISAIPYRLERFLAFVFSHGFLDSERRIRKEQLKRKIRPDRLLKAPNVCLDQIPEESILRARARILEGVEAREDSLALKERELASLESKLQQATRELERTIELRVADALNALQTKEAQLASEREALTKLKRELSEERAKLTAELTAFNTERASFAEEFQNAADYPNKLVEIRALKERIASLEAALKQKILG